MDSRELNGSNSNFVSGPGYSIVNVHVMNRAVNIMAAVNLSICQVNCQFDISVADNPRYTVSDRTNDRSFTTGSSQLITSYT